jgi:hypothetical protein
MAATYEPIASTTLGTAAASYTFSSIPGTYTDLILSFEGNVTSGDYLYLRVNGDTGNNYSRTLLSGSGSAASSSRTSNFSAFYASIGTSSTARGLGRVQFQSYANTSVYKTMLVDGGSAGAYVQNQVALWRSTAAISSITVLGGAGNLDTGFTLSLYGLAAA